MKKVGNNKIYAHSKISSKWDNIWKKRRYFEQKNFENLSNLKEGVDPLNSISFLESDIFGTDKKKALRNFAKD